MGSKRYDSNFAGAVDIQSTYNYYFMRLASIAMSCFKWDGLPDSVDPRFVEYTLFYNSNGLFFNDEVLGHLFLPCATAGNFDVYNIPTKRNAYASNGFQSMKTDKDSVLVYDNLMHMSLLPIIQTFCKRLTNIEITKDINLRAQKTPILLQCTQQQRLTLENLFMKIDMNVPVIYADKALDLDSLKVLDLHAPFLVSDLQKEKLNVMQEALAFLGVGGLEIEKRERLNTHETQEARQASTAQRENRLKARQQAAEQINKMFDLNVSVEYDNGTLTDYNNAPLAEPETGDDIV